MDLGLRGRSALVCSSTGGLGRATAEALAGEGVRVVISGRRADLARRIAAALPGAVAVPADLTRPCAAADLALGARAALGADPDIVVLNGPGPRPGGAVDVAGADLRAALDTLLLFQQDVLARLLPAMRTAGWGRVLAIGSTSVAEPLPGLVLSTVGRSALAAYLKTLAGEVARDGVTVNLLLPGRIDTDRVRSLDAARAAREERDVAAVAEANVALIPAGRYGTPQEFGAVAAFLCSDPAGYVTGSAIRCDGGLVGHL